MRRLPSLLVLLALIVPAPAALAQSGGSGAFGPLPPAQPVETPEPKQDDGNSLQDVSRETLFLVAAGVILTFVLLGTIITRDARRNLTDEDRAAVDGTRVPGSAPRKQDLAKMKQRQREKARRQRQARKKSRRR